MFKCCAYGPVLSVPKKLFFKSELKCLNFKTEHTEELD